MMLSIFGNNLVAHAHMEFKSDVKRADMENINKNKIWPESSLRKYSSPNKNRIIRKNQEKHKHLTEHGLKRSMDVTSYASNLAIPHALEMLFQPGWSFTIESDELKKIKISWLPGVDLTSLLENIGKRYEIAFVVDWNKRQVLVNNYSSNIVEIEKFDNYKHPVEVQSGSAKKEKNANTGKENTEVNLSTRESKDNIWELVPGGLKKQLKKWGEKANYHVIWAHDKNDDLLVDVGARFNGTFLNAIEETARSYRAFNVDIKIEEFPNTPKRILMLNITGDNS